MKVHQKSQRGRGNLSELCGTIREDDGTPIERREERRTDDARVRRHHGAIGGHVQDALQSAGDSRLGKLIVAEAGGSKGVTQIKLEVPPDISMSAAREAVSGASGYITRYVTEMMNGKKAPAIQYELVPQAAAETI